MTTHQQTIRIADFTPWKSKWLTFIEQANLLKRKTRTWQVYSADGVYILGVVRWYPPWRKYVFDLGPLGGYIFEQDCLRDIARFLEENTMAQRCEAKWRKRKGNKNKADKKLVGDMLKKECEADEHMQDYPPQD